MKIYVDQMDFHACRQAKHFCSCGRWITAFQGSLINFINYYANWAKPKKDLLLKLKNILTMIMSQYRFPADRKVKPRRCSCEGMTLL